MPRGPHLTLAEQAQIDVLKKNGLSLRNIASQLNRSVYCIFHYSQNPQGYGQKKRCGRPRLLTKHDERHIGRLVSNSTLSANQLRQRLQLKVKKDTILRSIHRNKHIQRQVMKPAPQLKDVHKKAREEFACNNMATAWDNIVFSDEKKWNLDGPDGSNHYWRDLRKDKISIQRFSTRFFLTLHYYSRIRLYLHS